ncbi:hypothetical protein [Methylobacterium aquaticum]|uniref:hypothetical protein n=1 Tax=Methylobacterium aquaticum TaxID=270351 RepID=UPI0011AE3D42|nr:hypothetical protein [Methylobacterium aquaticum]
MTIVSAINAPSITKSLFLIDKNIKRKALIKGWNEYSGTDDRTKIQLIAENVDVEAFSDRGYFRCLVNIREKLEKLNINIECYGSCENVYPSPMIEAMGYGIKAYRLQMGQRATNSNLVCIFDHEPRLKLATVADQELFYKRWLGSIA